MIQKIEGSSMCLIFLGIELDTVRLEMRLPVERIVHLKKDLLRSRNRGSFFHSLGSSLTHARSW